MPSRCRTPASRSFGDTLHDRSHGLRRRRRQGLSALRRVRSHDGSEARRRHDLHRRQDAGSHAAGLLRGRVPHQAQRHLFEIYAAGQNPATSTTRPRRAPSGRGLQGARPGCVPGCRGTGRPTNHSGVAQFGDRWFIVYHISNGPNGGGTYRREVAIDELTFNSDGTIRKVVPSSGLSF